MFKKADFFLISLFLVCAVAITVVFAQKHSGDGQFLTVYRNGDFYASLPLTGNETFDIDGFMSVRISNGSAYVTYSSCKDQYCKNHGSISKTGEFIICLPNRVVIRVEGDGGLDGITY